MQPNVMIGSGANTREVKRALRQWGWLTVCCLSSIGVLASCSGGNVSEDESSDEADNDESNDKSNDESNDESNDDSDDENNDSAEDSDDTNANENGDGGTELVPDDVVTEDGCYSNREFLATEAWKGVIESKCLSCHGPGGIAEAQAANLQSNPRRTRGSWMLTWQN